MAKNQSNTVPHYELLYIVSNKFTKDELGPIQESVEKIITDNEGEITFKETWGKKKLAYEIKHFKHGYYSLVEFDLAGINLQKVNSLLNMAANVLRHQIIVKKKLTTTEIEKEKTKAQELFNSTFGKEMKKDELKPKASKSALKSTAKKEVKKKEVKEKVNQKELDEKLDKILETDDLL